MYEYNSATRRLEPTFTDCQYCGLGNSSSMEDNYFIPMFKGSVRTDSLVSPSIMYSRLPIGVPRCSDCKSIHEQAARRAKQIAWGVVTVLVILVFNIWGIFGLLAMFGGIFIGFVATLWLTDKLIRDKGICTKLEGAKQSSGVENLISNGWSFTLPST